MRYYVRFDSNGNLQSHMQYEHLNATMQEVTKEEYARILSENGIEVPKSEEERYLSEILDLI